MYTAQVVARIVVTIGSHIHYVICLTECQITLSHCFVHDCPPLRPMPGLPSARITVEPSVYLVDSLPKPL